MQNSFEIRSRWKDAASLPMLLRGISLGCMGSANLAWCSRDARSIVSMMREKQDGLLGFDVIGIQDDKLAYTYDSWHFASNVTLNDRCLDAIDKMAFYSKMRSSKCLFEIVLKDRSSMVQVNPFQDKELIAVLDRIDFKFDWNDIYYGYIKGFLQDQVVQDFAEIQIEQGSDSIEVCELLSFNCNDDLRILKGLRGPFTEERESIRWTMLRIAAMAVLEPTQTEFRFWIECLKKEEAFSESLVRILDQISGEDRLSEVVDLASKTVRPIQQ